jgi:hypothetical protein
MPRALCLIVTVLGLAAGAAPADAPPDLGANAALKYWQAFATLPKLGEADGQKLNAESLTMPLDAHARELVAKADYALEMMHRGAALPRCDWGVSYEDGVYVRLPHADGARTLSALACLRARLRFEDGQSAAAVDDLVAALTLGRHASRDGVLIMTVTGYGIEHRTTDALAQHLPRLDAAAVRALKTRLDALPPGGSTSNGLRYEEISYLDWFVRTVKEAKDKDKLLAVLSPLFTPEGPGRLTPEQQAAKAREFLQRCGGTAEGVVKAAEETRSLYTAMVRKLDLPLDQFEKEFEREKIQRAGNPVFAVFFPAITNVRRAQARTDVRRAMLAAALAVRLDGQGALKDHPDPTTGRPFEYAAFEAGFELRSTLKGRDDKPVTLTVGRRGA